MGGREEGAVGPRGAARAGLRTDGAVAADACAGACVRGSRSSAWSALRNASSCSGASACECASADGAAASKGAKSSALLRRVAGLLGARSLGSRVAGAAQVGAEESGDREGLEPNHGRFRSAVQVLGFLKHAKGDDVDFLRLSRLSLGGESSCGKRSSEVSSTFKASRVCKALSDITAMRAVHFAGFDEGSLGLQKEPARASSPAPPPVPLQATSFKEGRAVQLDCDSRSEWQRHNRRYISRVYPSGRRVDSSNPSDTTACRVWSSGVQMLALNIQTLDAAMMVNQAMFTQNGNCGYVLRPPMYPGETAERPRGVRLTLRVISAHNLPKSRDEGVLPADAHLNDEICSSRPQSTSGVISPCVEVELVGGSLSNDGSVEMCNRWTRTTAVSEDNGLNPDWDKGEGEAFSCRVWTPTHTFLKLLVYATRKSRLGGRTRTLIAYAAAPVHALRGGYRSLQLHSPVSGTTIEFGVLLLHLNFAQLTAAPELPQPSDRSYSSSARARSLRSANIGSVRNAFGSVRGSVCGAATSRNNRELSCDELGEGTAMG
eukprot:3183187-Pleurochrysis_carterae.AAC.1